MRNPLRAIRQFLADMKDQKLSRELVGVDKFGNKYFQYYSPYGLPTRREIEYAARKRKKTYEDLAFYRWMHRLEALPPTESEVKEYHRLEKERKKAAIEWDKKEQLLIEEFYKQKFITEGKWKDPSIEYKEDFSVEGWKPIAGKRRGRKFDQDDDI